MASKLPLLPLINRNNQRNLDHNGSGLVAYGSRSCIYILNFTTVPPTVVDSKVIPNAHTGKVLSVSFCKSIGNELLASNSEDGSIKIWDLETSSCVKSLDCREGFRVVEWLHGSTNSVAISDLTVVMKWNYATNNLVRMKTGSGSLIQMLSSSKKCPELLAVGHSVGSISILNVNHQTLLHKLKGHTMDITSLCWSMETPNTLLSTSLDQSARVWVIGDDKPVKTYFYPKSRYYSEDKKNAKICAAFHPDNTDAIICSNVRGDFGEVIFRENEVPKFTSYSVKPGESPFKSVNIIIPLVIENKKVLLTSDHLKMALWDVSARKLISTFYYISLSVYGLSLSTINSHQLAVGSGDGFVRVWNMSKLSEVEISTIYIHARVRIMCVAWHPSDETIIAYASHEGRVGIADVLKKKSLYSFETHHAAGVYSLQWSPCFKIKDSENDFFLYSCGGGNIYIHELHKPKEKPADFDDLVTYPSDIERHPKSYTDLNWKSDYTCLAVASSKGHMDLFDRQFKFLTRVTIQMSCVDSLKWHPQHTFSSLTGSNYCSWFAVAGISDKIYIFDASDALNGESGTTLCKHSRVLSGHKKRVSSICWSPHMDGHLLSGSRDGTVQVWNAITTTLMATYIWHKDLVFTVQWSMNDPDVVFSGGMDSCLRVWKISEQTESGPLARCQLIKHKGYKQQTFKESSPKSIKSAESVSLHNGELLESQSKEEITVVSPEDKNVKSKAEMHFSTDLKKGGLFPAYSNKLKENVENILKLTDLLSEKTDSCDSEDVTLISDKVNDEESELFGFYCDQLTAVKMLETRANFEEGAGCIEKASYLNLMANNIEPFLRSAFEKKELTDFLVASAATVSRKFYDEMCEKYALQLLEANKIMKASLYFLFCGKIHNGIKVLLDKRRVLEALAIAKARLPPNDPFLETVLHKAIVHFSINRAKETEAACYLALKQPLRAAQTLYCSGDSKSIYISAYICHKFGLTEEAESYGYFCMEKCLIQNDWPTFYKVAEIVDSLKVYKVLVRVHELISTQIKTLKKEDGLDCNKLFGVTGSKLKIWESKTVENSSSISFLPLLYSILEEEHIIPEDKESLEKIHKALISMAEKRKKYEVSAEAHISVAIYISQLVIASFLKDFNMATRYFMKIFPATCNVVFLPRIIFWLLLPIDIYWHCNEDSFYCENKYAQANLLPFQYFMTVCESLCDKISSMNKSGSEDFIINKNILSSMNVVEHVSSILSKKTDGDSLLLYFSLCYLNELRRATKHGWKFRCYNQPIPSDRNIKEPLHNGESSFSVSNKNSEGKSVMFITDVQEKSKLEDLCEKSESQNMTNASGSKAVLGIFPPELDTDTKNKIAQHHGWANFTEFADKVMNNKIPEDEVSSSPIQDNIMLVSDKNDGIFINEASGVGDGISEESFLKDANGTVNQNESSGSKNCKTETCEDYAVEDQTNKFTENCKTEVSSLNNVNEIDNEKESLNRTGNDASNLAESCLTESSFAERSNEIANESESSGSICNKSEIEVSFSNSMNGAVNEKESSGTVCSRTEIEHEKFSCKISGNETVLNEKIVASNALSQDIADNKNAEVSMASDLDEDDHAQCWSDISLCYVLTKNFISITCKDEYALLYYLQKLLCHLDKNIAQLSRQPSKPPVTCNDSDKGPVVTEKEFSSECNSSKDLIESDSKNSTASNFPVHGTTENGSFDEVSIRNEIQNKNAENQIIEEGVNINNVNENDKLSNETSADVPEKELPPEQPNASRNLIENNSKNLPALETKESSSFENVTSCALLENEIQNGNTENQMLEKINNVNETTRFLDEANAEIPQKENQNDTISIEICKITDQEIISQKLKTEHEEFSKQIQYLNSVEFDYPSPFDAVSVINGICCDIVHKNPCKVIQDKFHMLLHQVNKWNAKFCIENETIKCDICHKTC